MKPPTFLNRIDAIIAVLSEDLSLADRRDGWTEASRNAMRAFFQQMRTDVVAGKEVSKMPHYIALVRGLDHWGICGGRLFEEAATIGKLVKDAG